MQVVAPGKFINDQLKAKTIMAKTTGSKVLADMFKAYGITNDACRTMFSEISVTNILMPAISQFDMFQENLLQSYAHYCQMIHAVPAAGN